MKRLPTVSEAKQEIKALQAYVLLAEEYPEKTIKQQILKLYAYTVSIKEVVAEINTELEKQQLKPIDTGFVSNVIQSRPGMIDYTNCSELITWPRQSTFERKHRTKASGNMYDTAFLFLNQ